MSHFHRLWQPGLVRGHLCCSSRRLILKLSLGDAPRDIPCAADVRLGTASPSTTVDGGVIDRIVRRFAGSIQIVRLHTSAAGNGKPGRRHVGFDDLEHAFGLSRTFRIDIQHACNVSDFVDALQQLDRVESASPYYLTAVPFSSVTTSGLQPRVANRVSFAQQAEEHAGPGVTVDLEEAWRSRRQIHAAEAMAYELGDPSVIVAVVDTGVAQSHQELSGQLRPGLDTVQMGSPDLSSGMELLGDRTGIDTYPEDEVGHGTACAAVISALGRHIPPGLAGACGCLPIRVLAAAQMAGRSAPVGIGATADIDMGVKTAIDLGAAVMNMSFGTPRSSIPSKAALPHEDVVRYGQARGCVMVAASGNSGIAEVYSPAALPGVITVGSVGPDGTPSKFSTSGPHVDISAPGERVVSAGLHGYQLVTGTSFAAPFVAATAALLISRARRRSFALGSEAIRSILQESAQPWRSGQADGSGTGVLDALAALRLLDRRIEQSTEDRAHVSIGLPQPGQES